MKGTRNVLLLILLILLIFPLIQLPNVNAAPMHNSPYGASILLTFDNDIENMVDNVLPIMVEYGYRGIAFVPSSRIFNRRLDYLVTLIEAGWEMGSRSHEDLALSKLTYEEREYQLSHPRELFESVPEIDEVITYTPHDLVSVYEPEIREQILMHYRYIRPATSSGRFMKAYGFWDPLGRTFSTKRVVSAIGKAEDGIAYAIKNDCPVWFMTNKVKPTSTGERVLSFDMFRTILDLVEASGLPVVTMRDLAGMSPYVNSEPSSPPEQIPAPSPTNTTSPSPTNTTSNVINELTEETVIYWSADFETGDFSEVEGRGKLAHYPPGTEVSVVSDPVYKGNYAMKAEIVDPSARGRAEIARYGQTDESMSIHDLEKAYYGCAIYLPLDFDIPSTSKSYHIIFQLHITGRTPTGEKARGIFAALQIKNRGDLDVFYFNTKMNRIHVKRWEDTNPVPLGRWFTVIIYLDATVNGSVKLWIDGDLKGEWHDDFKSDGYVGPHLQAGIYQSKGDSSRTVYHDRFIVASDLNTVLGWLN